MADIYFSPAYGEIWAQTEQAEFKLFKYEKENYQVVYPLLIRKIDATWQDVISPYGYSGPLSNRIDPELYQEFRLNFNNWCQQNHIVSEFIRFHPLLKNYQEAEGSVKLIKRGETVWIDLKKPEKKLWQDLRKGHKGSIKKAQAAGMIIKPQTVDSIDKFYRLYQQTMERKDAKTYYHFNQKFFNNHFDKLTDQVFWTGAFLKNKLVAGAMFLKKPPLIHYHFAASDAVAKNLSPGTLLIWENILAAKKLGLTKFHLGGGIDDNLYFYKQGFSPLRADFYTGEKIHHPQVYNTLSRGKTNADSGFFPLYRQEKK